MNKQAIKLVNSEPLITWPIKKPTDIAGSLVTVKNLDVMISLFCGGAWSGIGEVLTGGEAAKQCSKGEAFIAAAETVEGGLSFPGSGPKPFLCILRTRSFLSEGAHEVTLLDIFLPQVITCNSEGQ